MPKAKARYQPGAAKNRKRPEREVDLPDMGASFLLRKPTVQAFIDAQKHITAETEEFDDALRLVAITLVEPELDMDALRAEVVDWSTEDWVTLQSGALDLLGISKLKEIQATFR